MWITDMNDDGVPDTTRYSDTIFCPDLNDELKGRAVDITKFKAINGETILIANARPDKVDQRLAGSIVLFFDVMDSALKIIVEEDYAKGRMVGIRLDHRWRQLEVIDTGTNKVTIAAGYIEYDADTFWLNSSTEITVDVGDTKVYATPQTDGTIICDSSTVVPTGSVELASLSSGNLVAGDTGYVNMFVGKVISVVFKPIEGRLTQGEITIQEVR